MRHLLASCLSLIALWLPGHAAAEDEVQDKPWCAPELEVLNDDICYHAAPNAGASEGPNAGRRTLVIFLHGLVQKGAGWQHNQQRGIVRGARRLGFSVITPRGRDGANRRGADMVAWPTSMAAQAKWEDEIIAEWTRARASIEARQGAAFDEVFVVGFSNGAYYGASLALRGRADVNGYAVFAGGAGAGSPTSDASKRAPVFVGIAGKDPTTAKDSRAFARTLKKHGWPHRAETRPVGHAIADKHLDHALAYLREQMRDAK